MPDAAAPAVSIALRDQWIVSNIRDLTSSLQRESPFDAHQADLAGRQVVPLRANVWGGQLLVMAVLSGPFSLG